MAERAKSVKATTVNNDLKVLTTIIRTGLDEELIEKPPFRIRKLKALKKRDLKALSRKDVERLLVREGALVRCPAPVGDHRPSPGRVAQPHWADVDLDDSCIDVRPKRDWKPKTHQCRRVYVNEKVVGYLRRKWQNDVLGEPHDYLFSPEPGRPHGLLMAGLGDSRTE